MPDDNFTKALKFVLKEEGGYVNNPDDNGGETNFGISKNAFPNKDIKHLTVEDAIEIYKQQYWNRCQCQYFTYPIALIVFDAAVMSGISRASKWLQKSANVLAEKQGPRESHGQSGRDGPDLLSARKGPPTGIPDRSSKVSRFEWGKAEVSAQPGRHHEPMERVLDIRDPHSDS